MLAEPPPSLRSVTGCVLPSQRRRPADPPATAETRYWRRLLPVLAALALLTRLPSFRHPLWNPDEGYLAVQARLLASGGTLYTTVVDRKPPLLPWLYEAAFALCGSASLTPLRLAAAGAQLLTALALAATARRRWGERAGRTAGVLYLLVSVGLNPEDAQAATFEIFMLPFTAAAVLCADRGHWTRAGLAVAGACLTKQTGGAALAPVLWLLWHHPGPRRTPLLRTVVGLALPIVAVAWLTGPARFLFWTVTGSAAYASFTGSELHILTRGLTNTALLATGCAGLLPPVVRVLRIARTGAVDLWLWLASSAGAVLLGFHFFGHYYLQLIPPLVLLATGALHILPTHRLTNALALSTCACALFLAWGLLAPRPDLAHTQRLAAAVEARTGPTERVLVWGIHPETYWLAGRTPASRFLTAGLLTNYSGGRDGSQVGEKYGVEGAWRDFRAELAARPPALVVDDSRGSPYAPGRLPTLRRFLASHYERSGEVDGAVFYVRAR